MEHVVERLKNGKEGTSFIVDQSFNIRISTMDHEGIRSYYGLDKNEVLTEGYVFNRDGKIEVMVNPNRNYPDDENIYEAVVSKIQSSLEKLIKEN